MEQLVNERLKIAGAFKRSIGAPLSHTKDVLHQWVLLEESVWKSILLLSPDLDFIKQLWGTLTHRLIKIPVFFCL